MTQESTRAGRRFGRYGALAAVALVPLAFAGLVVGALKPVDDGANSIPAAIVNNDKLITATAADGTESKIFAGRQLVTELTGGDAAGFDCPKHGKFKVSDTVFSRNLRGDWAAALARAKAHVAEGELPTIRTYDFNSRNQ